MASTSAPAQEAVVERCFVMTEDDALCAKATKPGVPSINLLLRHNVVGTESAALKRCASWSKRPGSDHLFIKHLRLGDQPLQFRDDPRIMSNAALQNLIVELQAGAVRRALSP